MNKMEGEKSRKMKVKDLRKQAKGITLIALVITIIVLLILAAVSIATLTGENGILTRANDAKMQTEIGEEKEAIGLAYNGAMAKNNGRGVSYQDLNDQFELNGRTDANANRGNPITVTFDSGRAYEIDVNGNIAETKPPITFEQAKEDSMLGEKTDSKVAVDDATVTVPAGFQIAQDSGNAIDEGIVIEDINDNQFVWVPVEDFEEFKREHFGTSSQKWWSGTFVTDGLSANNLYEPTSDGEANNSEVEKMYRSVKYNGGFYVGRYEAGKDKTNPEKVVVQKGADVYNEIGWADTDDMKDETGGAVELARNFDTQNEYTTVESTLIYGVQWDAIMRWMKDEPNLTGGKYVQDSTGMGWYSDNSEDEVHQTGIDVDSNKSNCVKNIYDLAGNVREWTMESCNTNNRVPRGGHYNDLGSSHPVSARYSIYPSNSNSNSSNVGFRVALYLKKKV